ncbi:hypothetical protein LY78DRAFT_672012 [Colletotrichum sublineola]|nr:hypothetical protein LY78DRAFT_672012 [Colletotrichum sublineola]
MDDNDPATPANDGTVAPLETLLGPDIDCDMVGLKPSKAITIVDDDSTSTSSDEDDPLMTADDLELKRLLRKTNIENIKRAWEEEAQMEDHDGTTAHHERTGPIIPDSWIDKVNQDDTTLHHELAGPTPPDFETDRAQFDRSHFYTDYDDSQTDRRPFELQLDLPVYRRYYIPVLQAGSTPVWYTEGRAFIYNTCWALNKNALGGYCIPDETVLDFSLPQTQMPWLPDNGRLVGNIPCIHYDNPVLGKDYASPVAACTTDHCYATTIKTSPDISLAYNRSVRVWQSTSYSIRKKNAWVFKPTTPHNRRHAFQLPKQLGEPEGHKRKATEELEGDGEDLEADSTKTSHDKEELQVASEDIKPQDPPRSPTASHEPEPQKNSTVRKKAKRQPTTEEKSAKQEASNFTDRDFQQDRNAQWKHPTPTTYDLMPKQLKALSHATTVFNNDPEHDIFTRTDKLAILRVLIAPTNASQQRGDFTSYPACRAYLKALKGTKTPDFLDACTTLLLYSFTPPDSWPDGPTPTYVRLLKTLSLSKYEHQESVDSLLVKLGQREAPPKPKPPVEPKVTPELTTTARPPPRKPKLTMTPIRVVYNVGPPPDTPAPQLTREHQEYREYIAQWRDTNTFENRIRLDNTRVILTNHYWTDLDQYAAHLHHNADTTHDERMVIHANLLREVEARWANLPTTLTPRYYQPMTDPYKPATDSSGNGTD